MKVLGQNVSLRGVGIGLSNVLLAAAFGTFAYAHLQGFLENPRLSVLLIVVVEALIALMVLVRRDPDETWHSGNTWITTFGGTFASLMLRPPDVSHDLLVGQLIQVVGFGLQIVALLALGRSFGLLPAHRGVKSSGVYRWVRHPLYSSYVLAHAGYLINNFTTWNLGILLLVTSFHVLRILNEERLLLSYPDYVRYAEQTRWRLVPAVW